MTRPVVPLVSKANVKLYLPKIAKLMERFARVVLIHSVLASLVSPVLIVTTALATVREFVVYVIQLITVSQTNDVEMRNVLTPSALWIQPV